MSDKYWVGTTEASLQLGRSPATLKRYRDINGGFLEAGIHYCLGGYSNSPCTWNVAAIRKALKHRGRTFRNAT